MASDREHDPDPGITVVIPVWDDYVRFLPEAIESINLGAARVLLVDNASTEAVPSVPGAEIVRAPSRLSVGAARNLGIDAVETEYVLVMDVDDRLFPGTLEFLRERMDDDPSLSICATLIVDSETGVRHRNPRPFVLPLTRARRTFAALECVWSFLPIQGCALLRTEHVRAAGGYPDTDWGDDWVLAMSLAFRGRIEVNDRFGRYYRATPGSLRAERGLRDDLASARLVRRRIREDGAVPASAVAALPLITVLQMLIVFAIRPALVIARRLRRSGR